MPAWPALRAAPGLAAAPPPQKRAVTAREMDRSSTTRCRTPVCGSAKKMRTQHGAELHCTGRHKNTFIMTTTLRVRLNFYVSLKDMVRQNKQVPKGTKCRKGGGSPMRVARRCSAVSESGRLQRQKVSGPAVTRGWSEVFVSESGRLQRQKVSGPAVTRGPFARLMHPSRSSGCPPIVPCLESLLHLSDVVSDLLHVFDRQHPASLRRSLRLVDPGALGLKHPLHRFDH